MLRQAQCSEAQDSIAARPRVDPKPASQVSAGNFSWRRYLANRKLGAVYLGDHDESRPLSLS